MRESDLLKEIVKEEVEKRGGSTRCLVLINGVLKSKREWCAEYGISLRVYEHRVNNEGMTPYEALTTRLHRKSP